MHTVLPVVQTGTQKYVSQCDHSAHFVYKIIMIIMIKKKSKNKKKIIIKYNEEKKKNRKKNIFYIAKFRIFRISYYRNVFCYT